MSTPKDGTVERDVQPPLVRWLILSFFVLCSALNYLDRSLLGALAPVLKHQYDFSDQDYGYLVAAFSVTYALASPLLGVLMDRIGLTPVVSLAVGVWSLAGMATGFVRSFGELLWCRVALGMGEAGGIPGTGKAYGTYLLPKERALGAGVGQLAISFGSLAAPLLAAWALHRGHWQWAFVVAGGLGFLWIAGWLLTHRAFPPKHVQSSAVPVTARDGGPTGVLGDPRYWRLLLANFLWMSIYLLWPAWTTLFLTSRYHLTADVANQLYAWIPPLGATAGALAGGWLSMVLVARGMREVRARLRVCLITAVLALVTAVVPHAPTPALATLGIALSYCFVAAGSTNLYTIPVDLYGAERSAFAVSGFVAAFGATGFVFSPLFGWMVQHLGNYALLCAGVALLPLVAYAVVASISCASLPVPHRTSS
jgi:ACS family hexuronate transporter-like MFS transporter